MRAASVLRGEAMLEATVARCRRRAGRVLVARYSVIASALTLGTISAVRLLQPEGINEPALNALLIVGGVVCVAVAAARRYPTLRDVASTIDRHFELDDAVVAALQAHRGNTATAVAPLVVRQAVERTAAIDPHAVFPMELRRPALMLAAAMVLVVAALPRGGDTANKVAFGRTTGAGGRAVAPGRGAQGTHGSNSADQRSRNGAERSEGGAARTAQRDARETETPAAEDRRAESPARPGVTDSSPPNGASGAALQSRNAPAGGVRGAGGAAETGGGRVGTGAARAETRADSTGSGSGGAATGGSRLIGSGGVRSGDLLASRRPPTSTGTTSTEQPSRYDEAQRNAEAALARGDIPPELRSYVREYFRAITR